MATKDQEPEKECVYKTKFVKFLGRTTPIILQNDNGPCPLIAICNVLLLRNILDLGENSTDVSLQRLLSLVAERLIDSNSNFENKDAGYVKNLEKNIADAIDLLPRLSTGIDVNIQFRRINDFEFTPECAIFDLLGIPLYHGWIVDPQGLGNENGLDLVPVLVDLDLNPFSYISSFMCFDQVGSQDYDTANAIGSKSYNALMGELVALETSGAVKEQQSYPEENCIDFFAATTATLGVPTPSLSRARSFDDDSLQSISYLHEERVGDLEEEAILRTLKLSTVESPTPMDSLPTDASVNTFLSSDESPHLRSPGLDVHDDSLDVPTCNEHHQPEKSTSQNCNVTSSDNNGGIALDTLSLENSRSCMEVATGDSVQSSCKESGELGFLAKHLTPSVIDVSEAVKEHHLPEQSTSQNCNISITKEAGVLDLVASHIRDVLLQNGSTSGAYKYNVPESGEVQQDTSLSDNGSTLELASSSVPSARNADFDFSCGRKQPIDVPSGVTSNLDGREPMYEGEECILDTGLTIYEAREPIYEGEMALIEQAAGDACTPQQGYLIGSFLRNNASQLTIYGLLCLQAGLKEEELCIFFRNNHFSTMFKLNGELYLLATDQGYINQPDLVWEKFNEVNGDTVFMTGDFEEFQLESHPNGTWDEQKVMASTTDYLASIDSSTAAITTLSSDMQLAIALQQQEFEDQPQQQHNLQQSSSGSGGSRLVTGPNLQQSPSGGGSSRLVTGPEVPWWSRHCRYDKN